MEYNNNIYAHAKLIRNHGYEGIESYSSFEYCFDRPFMYQAELGWNIDTVEDYEGFLTRYAANRFPCDTEGARKALDIMAGVMENDRTANKMNSLEYYWFTYVTADEEYPRNFPGGAYKKIFDDKDAYMTYFEETIAKTKEAMAFFEGCEGEFAKVWYAIAKHYYTYSCEYFTMAKLAEGYNNGEIDKAGVIAHLEDLLKLHEDFMATVEATRIEANSYVYMRNHSINRQVYVDLIDYFKNTDEPKLELCDLRYVASERFNKLR